MTFETDSKAKEDLWEKGFAALCRFKAREGTAAHLDFIWSEGIS